MHNLRSAVWLVYYRWYRRESQIHVLNLHPINRRSFDFCVFWVKAFTDISYVSVLRRKKIKCKDNNFGFVSVVTCYLIEIQVFVWYYCHYIRFTDTITTTWNGHSELKTFEYVVNSNERHKFLFVLETLNK